MGAAMMSSIKALVIGLDSADQGLLRKWCDDGSLPVLQSLRSRSRWGELSSPHGMADDAAWASFSTCVSPARHGRYSPRLLSRGSYDNPKFQDEDLKFETFWTALAHRGWRQAIVDVPKTPIAKDFNGVQIRDWIVHGRDGEISTWPSELANELLTSFGVDKTDDWRTENFLCKMTQLDERSLNYLAKDLLRTIELKKQFSLELMGSGGWDLYLTVFKETHCVGHQFWHLLDKSHPAYDPSLACRMGNPIKLIYQAVDAAINELLGRVGPNTHVIVFSTLGMGPNFTGDYLLDGVLERLEFAACMEQNRADVELGGVSQRRADNADLRGQGLSSRRYRRAFQVPHNEISGAIRINVCGREPHGLVQPGQDLEDLLSTLSRDLLDLENAETGRTIVQNVLRVSEVFEGDHLDMLPDLLVVWKRDAPLKVLRSRKLGTFEVCPPRLRTGNHVENGVYMISGPGIEPEEASEPASITDIGPTIAALLGSELPNVEGKSLIS